MSKSYSKPGSASAADEKSSSKKAPAIDLTTDSDPDDDFFVTELLAQGFFSLSQKCEAERIFKATHSFVTQKTISPSEKIKEFGMRLNTVSMENIRKVYEEIKSFGEIVALNKQDQKKYNDLLQFAHLMSSRNPQDFGFELKTKTFR